MPLELQALILSLASVSSAGAPDRQSRQALLTHGPKEVWRERMNCVNFTGTPFPLMPNKTCLHFCVDPMHRRQDCDFLVQLDPRVAIPIYLTQYDIQQTAPRIVSLTPRSRQWLAGASYLCQRDRIRLSLTHRTQIQSVSIVLASYDPVVSIKLLPLTFRTLAQARFWGAVQ